MILVDAGPLIAVIDRDDQEHSRCVAALESLDPPLVTTWPTFTEACYLLGDRAGWQGQELLWRLVIRTDLVIWDHGPAMRKRSRDLMEKYRDVPMDLADATLVAVAEAERLTRVFSLDQDFHIYRIKGRRAFTVIP